MSKNAYSVKRGGSHRGSTGRGITQIFQELSDCYGVSDRTIRRLAELGMVLGISRRNRKWLIESEQPGIEGPIPDVDQEYIIPARYRHCRPESVPGPVNGEIWQGTLVPQVKYTVVVERAAISGIRGYLHLGPATGPDAQRKDDGWTTFELRD